MKILAIDTASFPASAAVFDSGVILGEYVIRNQKKHSQNIMVMVERLFDDLNMNISEIDAFAVTVGPGSFTGLRIGISTARAFAQAMKKPAVAVNTLEGLAYNFACNEKTVIVPMLDARRDEVFAAAYEFKNGEMKEIIAPCVMTIREINERFSALNVIYAGDGAMRHCDELKGGKIAPAQLCEVRASSVAALAAKKAENGCIGEYGALRPLYLRKSQAEREYDERKAKGE